MSGGAVGADQTAVETAAGRIRGEAAGDLLVWRGIRYAEAPAGALRFRPPQPVRPWSGVRAAIEPGPVAWQSDLLPIAGARQTLQRSEDCLLVNVTRPAAPPPVRVAIPYWSGSMAADTRPALARTRLRAMARCWPGTDSSW